MKRRPLLQRPEVCWERVLEVSQVEELAVQEGDDLNEKSSLSHWKTSWRIGLVMMKTMR